jgi:hypothetical protein
MIQADYSTQLAGELRSRLTELDAQLASREALVQERDRVRAALQALAGAAVGAKQTASDRKPRRRRATARRAPRGQNRAKALETITDRPGIRVGELAQTTSIARPTIYSVTNALLADEAIEAVELPGGRRGFRARGSAKTS